MGGYILRQNYRLPKAEREALVCVTCNLPIRGVEYVAPRRWHSRVRRWGRYVNQRPSRRPTRHPECAEKVGIDYDLM